MPKLNSLIFLFSFLIILPASASIEPEEVRALEELKKFKWSRLVGDVPPCPSLDCRLTWAAAAIAFGDAGSYARRVKADKIKDYATSKGVHQNFEAVRKLETLEPTHPWHFEEQFQIPVKSDLNKIRDKVTDLAVDSRIFIEILINGIPTSIIFDSGATLTLPAGDPAAKTLDLLKTDSNNTSGLGKVEINSLSTAKEISVGNAKIQNLMVKKKYGLRNGDINAVGLLGYDFLLRFNSVTVDLQAGVIKFNSPSTNRGYCSPMELVIDNNRMPAGIATDILIENIPFKARIDTGANVDVVLHGENIMSQKVGKPSRVMAIDSGGNTAHLEEFEGSVSLDQKNQTHIILRSSHSHSDFKATLGIKFFIGRILTFDFKHSEFCLY
jgi:hypothetical protein